MPQAHRLDDIERACLELLRQYPAGISEYSLLKRLREADYALFPKLALGDNLGLFQSHFLLFHSLYRLRDRLHAEQLGVLQISAFLIELTGYEGAEAALCLKDPLREYYLDLANLDETGEADVQRLLDQFWRSISPVASPHVEEAMVTLELEQACDFSHVKAQYRRLVMQHHPDRGGEAVKMHELNDALEILRRHLNG